MKTLSQWVRHLDQNELPVLKQTARDLTALQSDDNDTAVNTLGKIIARDPIMTVKLLRYLQLHKRRAQTTEIVQVEQALLMLGMKKFYEQMAPKALIEDELKDHVPSLTRVLRVIHRSHRASEYAKDWAVRLRDLRFEEVRIAALLHDLAEILMWCFSPENMYAIYQRQRENRHLRSRDVQTEVFGFALVDLQRELALQWQLPQLLLTLMDDERAQQPRVRNVILAVNLARHSANGWDDAALNDDYKGIAELIRIDVEDVRQLVMPPATKTEAG